MSAPRLTVTVERIAAAAMTAGLAPHTTVATYRGQREIHLDDRIGPDSTFGVVRLGWRSGRVLYGSIHHGNQGPVQRFTDGRALLRALRALTPGGN